MTHIGNMEMINYQTQIHSLAPFIDRNDDDSLVYSRGSVWTR
jgi:hypothetical protein